MKLTFEKHREFGKTLSQIQCVVGDLATEVSKERGKSCDAARLAEAILEKIEMLRSSMDDLCYSDFPERASVDVYYPSVLDFSPVTGDP